jgi:REP element-mobilizing transposase RayT
MKRRRNKRRVLHHYVWATHQRLPLLTPEIEREVFRYLQQVCQDDGCEVLAIGGMPDHVHLLVVMSTTVTIAELMQHVKGGSSRFIRQRLKSGEWFAWQKHYAVFSVSWRDKERVAAYIQNQKRHHAEGTLWAEAEATFEEYAEESEGGIE